MNKRKAVISLAGYEDIFEDSMENGEREEVVRLPISQFHMFRNHPFRVVDDEKMEETVKSVKQYGILIPGIVRPLNTGGYEVIAGHRRWRACELAGFLHWVNIRDELCMKKLQIRSGIMKIRCMIRQ